MSPNFLIDFCVISQFQKADSDLNYVSLKLESEFTQQFADIGEEEVICALFALIYLKI